MYVAQPIEWTERGVVMLDQRKLPAEEISYIRLTPGQFIIFFPSDIHQPEVFQI